jgi:hypothetical protein
MEFLSKLFAKLTAALVGVKAPVDVAAQVKALYPDAMFVSDIFPSNALNIELVVLPSVEGELPENLKPLIQKKDGVVTVVFTGNTARAIAAVGGDPLVVGVAISEKLLSRTEIDEATGNALAKLTNVYNTIIPGQLTPAQVTKRVMGMAALLMQRNEAFKNAHEFQRALVTKFVVSGTVNLTLPDLVEGKLAKLGLKKLTEKDDGATLLVKLVEMQINTVLERALSGLKGDVTVH